MRKSIMGIPQQYLVDHQLDCTDAMILRYVAEFVASGKMVYRTFDGVKFFWMNYQTLLDELPILGFSKVSLRRRFLKYEYEGILLHQRVTSGGTFSFYSFTESAYSGLVVPVIDSLRVTRNIKRVATDVSNRLPSKAQAKTFSQNNLPSKKIGSRRKTPVDNSGRVSGFDYYKTLATLKEQAARIRSEVTQ